MDAAAPPLRRSGTKSRKRLDTLTVPLAIAVSGAAVMPLNQSQVASGSDLSAFYPEAPRAHGVAAKAHLMLSPPTLGQGRDEPLAIVAANLSIPFARDRVGFATPFLFRPNRETDLARSIDCLAAAGYYEAGTGAADQRAVLQVVLNRVRHPAFPHTVCGVVFQQSERRTGCQFTFTCDGSMGRRQPSPEAWEQARRIAAEALSGRVESAVGVATHYHTNWVLPAWSPQMDKIAAVRTHLFLRWRGPQGALSALRATYAGDEPAIAALARLSPAHASFFAPPQQREPALVRTFVVPVVPPAPLVERLPERRRAPEADTFLITLDPSNDPDEFLTLAQRRCTGQGYCKVIGWTDSRRKADQLPVSGTAIDAISFIFVRQAAQLTGEARWNCVEFPRADAAQCLRRGA